MTDVIEAFCPNPIVGTGEQLEWFTREQLDWMSLTFLAEHLTMLSDNDYEPGSLFVAPIQSALDRRAAAFERAGLDVTSAPAAEEGAERFRQLSLTQLMREAARTEDDGDLDEVLTELGERAAALETLICGGALSGETA